MIRQKEISDTIIVGLVKVERSWARGGSEGDENRFKNNNSTRRYLAAVVNIYSMWVFRICDFRNTQENF